MDLTQVEIEDLARLSQLELSTSEKAEFTRQLNQVLGLMAQLDRLNLSDSELVTQVVPLTNVFRSDRVGQSLDPEKVLANAPERLDNFFKLPKII